MKPILLFSNKILIVSNILYIETEIISKDECYIHIILNSFYKEERKITEKFISKNYIAAEIYLNIRTSQIEKLLGI